MERRRPGSGRTQTAPLGPHTDQPQQQREIPDIRILAILKGERPVTAHGNADMPTWGKTFSDMNVNLNVGQGRMHALVMYLEEIQAK